MVLLMLLLCCGLLGYLLGSIPTGYWVGWTFGGVDIRTQGSGSTGATNVLRTVGKGPAVLVLLVDVAKGILAVQLAEGLVLPVAEWVTGGGSLSGSWEAFQVQLGPWMGVVGGLAAVIGHSRSMWLNFKGGKSVATSLGILGAMAWPVALSTLGVWGIGIGLSRIVSLSSVVAAIAAPMLMLLFEQPLAYVLFALSGGVYVIGTHRRNIERLLAGTEPRIGQKLADTPSR